MRIEVEKTTKLSENLCSLYSSNFCSLRMKCGTRLTFPSPSFLKERRASSSNDSPPKVQQELHVREGPLLPDVPHHLEQLFQQRSRLGVEQIVVFAVLVVLPRGGVGVLAAQIDLAGGHTVADHLADVPQGDLHAGEAGFRGAVVYPVFEGSTASRSRAFTRRRSVSGRLR